MPRPLVKRPSAFWSTRPGSSTTSVWRHSVTSTTVELRHAGQRTEAANLRLRLPYPIRNALGRWRALISMMVGVGIALSIGMTILGVISAEMDLLTGDY